MAQIVPDLVRVRSMGRHVLLTHHKWIYPVPFKADRGPWAVGNFQPHGGNALNTVSIHVLFNPYIGLPYLPMALQACGSTCVPWKSYTYPVQSCDTGHRTNITCFPFPLCLLEIRLNGFPHHYRKAVRRRIFNYRVSGGRQQSVSKPGDGPNRYLPVLLTILCSRAGARHRAADVIASFRMNVMF